LEVVTWNKNGTDLFHDAPCCSFRCGFCKSAWEEENETTSVVDRDSRRHNDLSVHIHSNDRQDRKVDDWTMTEERVSAAAAAVAMASVSTFQLKTLHALGHHRRWHYRGHEQHLPHLLDLQAQQTQSQQGF
jgi:pyruvate-formate lyase-activating enzyme